MQEARRRKLGVKLGNHLAATEYTSYPLLLIPTRISPGNPGGGEVSRNLFGLASAAELVREVVLARIGPGQSADQPPTRHSPPRHHRTCRRFPLRVGGLGGAIGFLRTHHYKGTSRTRNAPPWDSTVGLCLWSWGAPLPPTADQ